MHWCFYWTTFPSCGKLALMLHPPQRLSLVAKTADVLRKHIGTRPAGEKLSSEREMGEELGVSRTTLRAALAKLQRERLIRSSHGRRHVIMRRGPCFGDPAPSRVVVLLSPSPLNPLHASRVLPLMNELQILLAKEQHQLKFLISHKCYGKQPQHHLEDLTARLRPVAWVLLRSTLAMQKWFQARGLPAVISGSRHLGVQLPSVDVDYRAVCRHAVGRFLAKGHRRLVLLNPKQSAAGDLTSEASFREAGATAGPDVETLVAHHDGTLEGICGRLDQLLARPDPPTGFLVSRVPHAVAALGHLIHRGRHFPEAAFISRDCHPVLEWVVPSVAFYKIEERAFAHKLTRLVLDITTGGNPLPIEHLLMPHFIRGKTLE